MFTKSLEESACELADAFFLDRAESSGSDTWSVLHTWPRAEKVVARGLLRQSLSFFLPLFLRDGVRRRRVVRNYSPLFPGYVFLRAEGDAPLPRSIENRVVHRLPVDDQQRIHEDLRRIHGLLRSGQQLSPEERLERGQPAEIIGGPLRGYRGTVVRRSTGRRFVVEVNFLSCGASVEVAPEQIRALPC